MRIKLLVLINNNTCEALKGKIFLSRLHKIICIDTCISTVFDTVIRKHRNAVYLSSEQISLLGVEWYLQ